MDEKTQAEYDRIKAGPHEGLFTFLHHDGPVVEHSDNVMERVHFTLRNKPASEHYDRLRHIYRLPPEIAKACKEAWALYDKACQEARALYDKTCQEARALYDKARQEAGVLYDKACR